MENREDTGTVIHAYVRAKWSSKRDQSEVIRLAGLLGREVLQRINALGFDAEKLLEVQADEALSRLQTLEDEALLEDAGIAASREHASTDHWTHMKSRPSAWGHQGRR